MVSSFKQGATYVLGIQPWAYEYKYALNSLLFNPFVFHPY